MARVVIAMVSWGLFGLLVVCWVWRCSGDAGVLLVVPRKLLLVRGTYGPSGRRSAWSNHGSSGPTRARVHERCQKSRGAEDVLEGTAQRRPFQFVVIWIGDAQPTYLQRGWQPGETTNLASR